MKITELDFDIWFGKHYKFSVNPFFRILAVSFIIVFLNIVLLANIQFENINQKIKNDFKNQYQELTYQSISKTTDIDQAVVSKKNTPTPSQARIKIDVEKSLRDLAPNKKKLKLSVKSIPDFEPAEQAAGGGFNDYVTIPVFNTSPGEVKSDINHTMDDPYEYKITRSAKLYIDTPTNEFGEENYGHRSQEEIFWVVDSKKLNIESCYQKAVRKGTVKSGFVKVEFKISNEGFILPQSVKIIESNLYNRIVEQCIKKNIRRLRGFQKLEERRGIAHAVYKFVFN